jgi:hypothetical protein
MEHDADGYLPLRFKRVDLKRLQDSCWETILRDGALCELRIHYATFDTLKMPWAATRVISNRLQPHRVNLVDLSLRECLVLPDARLGDALYLDPRPLYDAGLVRRPKQD